MPRSYWGVASQISYTSGGTPADPAGSPVAVVQMQAATGQPTGSVGGADDSVWQPSGGRGHVVREWGQDREGTAIAASKYNFAAHGDTADPRSQAGAVVLSRSDQYADALAGSSLAVRKNAPLLITSPTALDPTVRDEIGRVLAPGGTIYVLGGTAALSPAVSNALTGLGYHVDRLAGPDRFTTALDIGGVIDPHPSFVIVATGTNYKDALAAGATGGVLVLTNGSSMPASSAAYRASENASLSIVDMLGGPVALPDSLIGQIGALFGASGGYVSFPAAAPKLPTLKQAATARSAVVAEGGAKGVTAAGATSH